jgi:hypothetical protein
MHFIVSMGVKCKQKGCFQNYFKMILIRLYETNQIIEYNKCLGQSVRRREIPVSPVSLHKYRQIPCNYAD